MKAKRHPVKGPLLTFALMLGSVGTIVAVDRYLESHRKHAEPTVATSTSNVETARSTNSNP